LQIIEDNRTTEYAELVREFSEFETKGQTSTEKILVINGFERASQAGEFQL
jgi:hypothetical protein